jgi:hypothetical protein
MTMTGSKTFYRGTAGGAGSTPARRGESTGGLAGWSEIVAADGHVLRCDWSRQGTRSEMSYEERPPAAGS